MRHSRIWRKVSLRWYVSLLWIWTYYNESNLQVLSKSAFKNKKRKVAAKQLDLPKPPYLLKRVLINNNKTCSSFGWFNWTNIKPSFWFRRANNQADALAAAANHAREIKESTYQVNNTKLVESSSNLIWDFLFSREPGESWQTPRGRKKQERWNFLSSFLPPLISWSNIGLLTVCRQPCHCSKLIISGLWSCGGWWQPRWRRWQLPWLNFSRAPLPVILAIAHLCRLLIPQQS